MSIPKWNDYFLELAKTAATRSNCLRAQVGAIIVGSDKMIKATGYNGTPSKVQSCVERNFCYRMENKIPSGTMYETCRSIHAEQNAIIQAGLDRCKDATMYIYGHEFICILCKRFIAQSGINGVYLKKDANSTIKFISVDEIKKELSEAGLKTNLKV